MEILNDIKVPVADENCGRIFNKQNFKSHIQRITSQEANLPGGAEQGTLMGLLQFFISVNKAGSNNYKEINEIIYTNQVHRTEPGLMKDHNAQL